MAQHNGSPRRVFLAVSLPEELREGVRKIQEQLRPQLPAINWVRAESIHLTFKFLGHVVPSLIAEIHSAVAPLGVLQPVLTAPVQGIGVFPDVRYPRILWVGLQDTHENLGRMAEALEHALEPLGFPREPKPFHPHLTLARIKRENKRVGAVLAERGLLQEEHRPGVLPIDRITLFESELQRTGAVYTPLWSVPLNGESAGP